MGDPSKASPTNMKTLIFALLVALAVADPEAKADPYLLYAHSGVLPYHYNPYIYNTVLKTEVKPVEEAETKTAEAVKPLVPLSYPYPYFPTVYNHHPLVYNTHLTYPYTYPIVPVVNK